MSPPLLPATGPFKENDGSSPSFSCLVVVARIGTIFLPESTKLSTRSCLLVDDAPSFTLGVSGRHRLQSFVPCLPISPPHRWRGCNTCKGR